VLIFAADTSLPILSVALVKDGQLLGASAVEGRSSRNEKLLPAIDWLLSETGSNRKEIDLFAVTRGPGSFTGVRIGVATAKGIAFALGKPIVGVSGLEAMAAALGEHAPALARDAGAVVALIDARKGEVFWGAYAPGGQLLAGPGHIAAARVRDVLSGLPSEKVVVGEIAEGLDLAGVRVHRSQETDLPDVVSLARLGVRAFERRGADDIDALEPIYLRPPDITLPKTK
jgi:tRNA threonylcarbamoyladenosine biosynthesis protein TsaB